MKSDIIIRLKKLGYDFISEGETVVFKEIANGVPFIFADWEEAKAYSDEWWNDKFGS